MKDLGLIADVKALTTDNKPFTSTNKIKWYLESERGEDHSFVRKTLNLRNFLLSSGVLKSFFRR